MGRILMVVTVWLVMAAMMLLIAIPVIAKNSGNQKEPGEQGPPSISGQEKKALLLSWVTLVEVPSA